MSFKNPLSVCYLPTNSADASSLGDYILKDGNCLFDIGILFAANINGTSDAPVLYLNDTVTTALQSGVIESLQSEGMKVILTILGNHQEAGISNLTTAGVASFSSQLVTLVNDYNLDGLDFDDEYSTGTRNDSSFPTLINSLRQSLPDKLLTFYCYGPAANTLSYNGINVANLLNYAWNPIYSTYNAPDIPGMSNSQLGAASVGLPHSNVPTDQSTADSFATRTKTDGNNYGVYMYWGLTNMNVNSYLSSISSILYGQTTHYTGSSASEEKESKPARENIVTNEVTKNEGNMKILYFIIAAVVGLAAYFGISYLLSS